MKPASLLSVFVESPENPSPGWLKGSWLVLILVVASLLCSLVMGGAAEGSDAAPAEQ